MKKSVAAAKKLSKTLRGGGGRFEVTRSVVKLRLFSGQ